jgi:hypothetical protein
MTVINFASDCANKKDETAFYWLKSILNFVNHSKTTQIDNLLNKHKDELECMVWTGLNSEMDMYLADELLDRFEENLENTSNTLYTLYSIYRNMVANSDI